MTGTARRLSREDEDFRSAEAWLAWDRNPCGKPRLILGDLAELSEPLEGAPRLGVDVPKEQFARDPQNRKIIFETLEAAWHRNRDFPGKLAGYHEGEFEGGGWCIEIYGEGDPLPVQPEPPKPRWMS